MTDKMEKAYEPKKYEDKIYKEWQDSGFFNPDNLDLPADAEPYTVILPPPNITDKLHLGHASMLAIEDLFVRYHRMKGFRALWLPGTDHAAIATQTAAEKKLIAEEGKTRHDLKREEFLDFVWKFLEETQRTILNQTAKMGASLDWSRLAFTLDDKRQAAVKEMFVRMYEEDLIYRGERVVNWCPHCTSTLADDEVEYKKQQTDFYTFKYDKDFPFAISTTRPETKLGDTAVAVNPADERYKKYIGQTLTADFCGQKLELKIIADPHVDKDFGTGALGVTPAHSMADWQMAQQNDLPLVKVIDEAGNIREGFGKFSGLPVKEARKMIAEELENRGLLKANEEIENNLSVCYRCDTPVEPLPSKQWFVAVDKPLDRLGGKSLKEKALSVVRDEKLIEFLPERFEKRYLDWMKNLHDWCISRQIWFGHRLPVWYKGEEVHVGDEPSGQGWTQDPDTLDTWFSSGMWTFSTLGWPDNFQDGQKQGDLARFHPTQMMETGYEIITLWVSRMVMMSLFALDEIPFEKVYLHGMVLDRHGKKMSKSKGNGIDPLDMIEAYGTDAVRLSLLIGTTPGNDLKVYEEKIETFRNFANKLWNISRYILEKEDAEEGDILPAEMTRADRWIMSRFTRLKEDVDSRLAAYEFSYAGEALREFTWNDFADWYLEATKFESGSQTGKVLRSVLKDLLKLWHPFMPFVTEAVWSRLSDDLLMVADWPKSNAEFIDKKSEDEFALTQQVITAIRNARSENKVDPARKIQAVIVAGDNTSLLIEQAELIKNLRTNIDELEIKEAGGKVDEAIFAQSGDIEIYLLGAVDKEKEKARLFKERADLENGIRAVKAKLDNEDFVDKAPAEVVTKEKEKLSAYEAELKRLNERLAEF